MKNSLIYNFGTPPEQQNFLCHADSLSSFHGHSLAWHCLPDSVDLCQSQASKKLYFQKENRLVIIWLSFQLR